MEELRLTLRRTTIRLVFETDGGSEKVLFLKELTGKDRDTYLSQVTRKMTFDSKGQPQGLKSFTGLQSGLLELCLFTEDGDRVGIAEIEQWPARTQMTLFMKAQEISALNQEGAEEAGNE